MFCSLMSVFMYFSGFESFAPLERWCDFAKFWCGKKKLVAVLDKLSCKQNEPDQTAIFFCFHENV